MISPPHNLKNPNEPTILSDYIRDEKGRVITADGSKLQVDENKNLRRDENKNLFLLDGTLVPVSQE